MSQMWENLQVQRIPPGPCVPPPQGLTTLLGIGIRPNLCKSVKIYIQEVNKQIRSVQKKNVSLELNMHTIIIKENFSIISVRLNMK